MKSLQNYFVLFFFLLLIKVSYNQKPIIHIWQEKPLISCKYSKDGNYLATLCSDKTITIWNTVNYKIIKILNDNKEGETSIGFSGDSKFIVSGSWDKTAKIWDIQKGCVIRRLIGHTMAIKTVAYHPNGSIVATGGWDNMIKIWYAPTGIILKNLEGHNQCVRCLAFSPDGKIIASGSDDTTVKLWDISTNSVIHEFKDHIYPIETLEFSPDQKYLASGSFGNNIIIWDIETKKIFRVLKGHNDAVYTISYSPDGKYLASGSSDKTIKIWDIDKGVCVKTFSGFNFTVKGVDFNPDGTELASVSADKSIRIWDVSDLNISPVISKTTLINAISEHKNIFHWTFPKDTVLEVYDRNITLKATLPKNITLDKTRLFINKKEYLEYNGYKTFVKNPTITTSFDNTKTNIEYQVYLYPGQNEIQLYAENNEGNSFAFSKTLNITYFDLKDQVETTDLHIVYINIPRYNYKKLEDNYIPNSIDKIKNILISQENILYHSVFIYPLETKDQLTKEGIENFINDVVMQAKDNDHLLIFISGIFVKNTTGETILLTPDYEYKDIDQHSVKMSYIGKKLSYVKGFTGFYADISNKPIKKSKEFSNPVMDDFINELKNNIIGKDNFSVEIIEGMPGNVFDIIANGFHIDNDADNNFSIDVDELHLFIDQLCKTEYYSKGRKVPLYIHKQLINKQ
ncbi:MAG: hypothetical protein Kow0068_03930 [Marinilabiliales bacterium]